MAKQNEEGKPRWSTRRGFIINCREQKLQFFYAGVTGGIKCVHQFPFSTRQSMADAVGLGDAQLEGAKNKSDRLSLATLEALGDYFGFDHTWSEFRNGTNEEFAKKYNEENRFQPKQRPLEAQERCTGVQLMRGPETPANPEQYPWARLDPRGSGSIRPRARGFRLRGLLRHTRLSLRITGPRSSAAMCVWIAEKRSCRARTAKGSDSPMKSGPIMAAGKSAGMRRRCRLRAGGSKWSAVRVSATLKFRPISQPWRRWRWRHSPLQFLRLAEGLRPASYRSRAAAR